MKNGSLSDSSVFFRALPTSIATRMLATALLSGLLMFSHAARAQPAPASSAGVDEREPWRDLFISGVYPHLTAYGIYSQGGAHRKGGHDEAGIGAAVPWADRLWFITYAPHMPKGSEHKLHSVAVTNKDQPHAGPSLAMTIHPESVGGTPAGRMIHRESNQLLIGHYLIDAGGKVRVISPSVMPGRITAIARHLSDPANMVYYFDMEGMLYEANVKTLAVKKLFHKPVPGWHGKGGYTSQGLLVIANNGEKAVGNYKQLLVGGAAKSMDEAGVLAAWDGKQWKIIERKQYTDVTGPDGIHGGKSGDEPLWAIGWDRRSLRLSLLDDGKWQTFLLPKAAHNNDPRHGWYTEWPRIREIGNTNGSNGQTLLMDMHGMFFDFPRSFAAGKTRGIKPVGSHLRYIPDFCEWNGRLVIASDETSIQGNHLAGQPQTNFWFGQYDDLKQWGPASGFGGPWVRDTVKADTPSEPFLIDGFDRRVIHLAVHRHAKAATPAKAGSPGALGNRASDQQAITALPAKLQRMPRVHVPRGNWKKPAPGFAFTVSQPVDVYLAVDNRGDTQPGDAWTLTDMTLKWGKGHSDRVFKRRFDAGKVTIPGNATEHIPGSFGMPHTAFVDLVEPGGKLKITAGDVVTVTKPIHPPNAESADAVKPDNALQKVRFTLEVDEQGDGRWRKLDTIDVAPAGDRDSAYTYHVLPGDLDATWLRVTVDRDCIATAYLHLTDADLRDRGKHAAMFAGLASVKDKGAKPLGARVYAAKRNRNLRVITEDDRYFEFTKAGFAFKADEPDKALDKLLKPKATFTADDASVIITHSGARLRVPFGDDGFNTPFTKHLPRAAREVQSERYLASIHGTFYELPLITNGRPPAYELMRPVASHDKAITDFCTWNGLLVLAGVSETAAKDVINTDAQHDPTRHVFASEDGKAALWFGGVDDLWKLGKPVGKGGPWKDAAVKANSASDPYLMKGYDQRTLTLTADKDVTITVEVDIDHQSGWHVYKQIEVKAGEPVKHVFPTSFTAHWVRFKASKACKATAWLLYE